MFALKAWRFATNRRELGELGEAGDSVPRFVNRGSTEPARKLGPIVWPFAPAKHCDRVDFTTFGSADGAAPARHSHLATVFTDSGSDTVFADLTGGFHSASMTRSATA